MLSNPPSTGDAKLDNFLKSVKRHIDDALRPKDGWRLSDFSADVSEVISDKRDLIDIVTRYDDINALKDSVDLILADYAEVIADFKAIGKQYEDHAEVFSHTMEWWNQNRKIIEDAAQAMAAALQASDYADAAEASAQRAGSHVEGVTQARDDAVTAKNEAQATATQVATQVDAAATHAGNAQTSAQDAATSATNAKTSETNAKTSETNAKTSETNAEAAADSAASDRVVVEQAATSASWSGDRLTVLGATSPSLKGPKGDPGEKGDPGDGTGDVLWSELKPALDGKADVGHDHTIEQVTGLEDALLAAGTAEHTHPLSEVDGLEAALDSKADVGHDHTIEQVTGLEDALLAAGTAEHTHPLSEVDGLEAALDSKADVGHDHTIGQVSGLRDELDSKAPAVHPHSWGEITSKPETYPPESHDHTASQISDATTVGRNVLRAADAATARQAIGAGTSNLALGTTSSTAAAGDHTHTPASIGAAPASHTHTAEQISDATTVGRNVLKASSQSAARTAIGAGTSNLALGTTSSTAAAGDHTHSQYATTAQVEARTPEIRTVSSPDLATSPGVLYVVMEG